MATKRKNKFGITVTHARLDRSTYDTSKVGYPGTGSQSAQLSQANYPRFDALITALLEDTLYNEQVPLGELIHLKQTGDEERLKEILAKSDYRGPPSGSGETSVFALYNDQGLVYEFEYSEEGYSGSLVQRLATLVADPGSTIFEDQSEMGKLIGLMELRLRGESYLRSVRYMASTEAPGRWQIIGDQFPEDLEYMSMWAEELGRMPGGGAGLHKAVVEMARAAIPFNRAYRAVESYCDEIKPMADDAGAASLYAKVGPAQKTFESAQAAFDQQVLQFYGDYFGKCAKSVEASEKNRCEILMLARELVIAHESATPDSAKTAAYLKLIDALPQAKTMAAKAFEAKARELPRVMEKMAKTPYYTVVEVDLLRAYLNRDKADVVPKAPSPPSPAPDLDLDFDLESALNTTH